MQAPFEIAVALQLTVGHHHCPIQDRVHFPSVGFEEKNHGAGEGVPCVQGVALILLI